MCGAKPRKPCRGCNSCGNLGRKGSRTWNRLEFAQDIALRKVHDEALARPGATQRRRKTSLWCWRKPSKIAGARERSASWARSYPPRRKWPKRSRSAAGRPERLNDLEGKWKALGEIRESDLITRADEAEALRTAVALAHRTTVERVNHLSIEVEKATISFEAATTRALARCSRRMASNEKRYGEKVSD